MTDEYRTTDLYFSAYLKAAGVPMTRADKNGTRITFVFNAALHNIPELQQKWWSKSDFVSACVYANELKNLKGLCHSLWQRSGTNHGSSPSGALSISR